MLNVARRGPAYLTALVVLVTAGAACATRFPPPLPEGLGVANHRLSLGLMEQLSKHCDVGDYRVAYTIRGVIGAEQISARVLAIFNSGRVRLEPSSPDGTPAWKLVANGPAATITFANGRVVRGPADDLMRGVIGVPVPAGAFALASIACRLEEQGTQGAGTMRVLSGHWGRFPISTGGALYVRRSWYGARWRPVTLFYSGPSLQWIGRIDLGDFLGPYPRRMRVRSPDARVDLDVRVAQLDTYVSVPPDFLALQTLDIPARPDPLEDGELLRR